MERETQADPALVQYHGEDCRFLQGSWSPQQPCATTGKGGTGLPPPQGRGVELSLRPQSHPPPLEE